jgi:hypothetical protein
MAQFPLSEGTAICSKDFVLSGRGHIWPSLRLNFGLFVFFKEGNGKGENKKNMEDNFWPNEDGAFE